MSERIPNYPDHYFPEETTRPIHPELTKLMVTTARYINAADDKVAELMMDDLNRKANETDMVGEVFQLKSDHIIQTRLKLNDNGLLEVSRGGHEPFSEDGQATVAQGVFVGFGHYTHTQNGRRTVMYRLETIADDESLSVDVVTAPVLGTEAAVIPPDGLVEINPPVDSKFIDFIIDEPEAYKSFKQLEKVEDPSFQRILHELMLHFGTPDVMKAATIAHIGDLSRKLINHPALKSDEVAQGVFVDLLSAKLVDTTSRWVTGDFLTTTEMGDNNYSVEIDKARALIQLGGIAMVSEYRLQGSQITHFSDVRQQPAFIVDRPDDQYYFIPLAHITEYAPVEPDYNSCDAALQRFRTSYKTFE